AALNLRAHALQRFGDRDDLSPGGVQRGGVDGLAVPEEDQEAFVGQVGGEIPVDAAVAVALGVRQQIVEMNEGEAGAMNNPAYLRKLEIREANQRIRQA